jgi:hypothetical protein
MKGFIMTETVQDIDVITNAIIAFEEGASDEKRAALSALRKMLERKMNSLREFEEELENA